MCKNIFTCLIFLCTFMCIENTVYSQTLLGGEHPAIQEARVGLVDEFLKRFNGDTSHPNISPQDTSYRKSNILYLIEPPQNIENKDSIYNEAIRFIDAIIKDSVRLNFHDSTWVARAKCKGMLDGKSVSFNIYLNVEYRKDDMYKWVISSVDGECFNVTPRNMASNIMLYPDDHEIKFISLGRMTNEQPFNVARFMSKGFKYDATSAFVYLVKSDKLKIEYVEELEFIFTQVPGYIFSIKYYERESSKLGWLINRFETISIEEKSKFLKALNLECNEQQLVEETANVSALGDENGILPKDSVSTSAVNNIEKIFLSRIDERKALVRDFISLLKEADKKEDIEYYKNKLLDLFYANPEVYLYSQSKDKTTKMSLTDFLKKVSSHKLEILSIDKIVVPIWDDTLIKADECNELQLTTKLELFAVYPSHTPEESSQITIVRKEQTEDGIEWMPYFGGLYGTIK